jgi:hypothetical protein
VSEERNTYSEDLGTGPERPIAGTVTRIDQVSVRTRRPRTAPGKNRSQAPRCSTRRERWPHGSRTRGRSLVGLSAFGSTGADRVASGSTRSSRLEASGMEDHGHRHRGWRGPSSSSVTADPSATGHGLMC